jgi:hypothetical protein
LVYDYLVITIFAPKNDFNRREHGPRRAGHLTGRGDLGDKFINQDGKTGHKN